jgi:hypothetical protein
MLAKRKAGFVILYRYTRSFLFNNKNITPNIFYANYKR